MLSSVSRWSLCGMWTWRSQRPCFASAAAWCGAPERLWRSAGTCRPVDRVSWWTAYLCSRTAAPLPEEHSRLWRAALCAMFRPVAVKPEWIFLTTKNSVECIRYCVRSKCSESVCMRILPSSFRSYADILQVSANRYSIKNYSLFGGTITRFGKCLRKWKNSLVWKWALLSCVQVQIHSRTSLRLAVVELSMNNVFVLRLPMRSI